MVRFEVDKYELNKEYYLAALLSVKEMTRWQKNYAAELMTNVDGEKFQKEVIEHRVYGLVMKNVQRLNLFTEGNCAKINEKANQQIFDSMKLSSELVKINQKFSEKGIRLLMMKGPILGNELYGDITKRTSRDLDILVSLKDVDKAKDALNELGYQTRCFNKYTAKQMDYIYLQGHHFDFWSSEGREIELHWKMSETWDATLEELWENRREIKFVGKQIAIPGETEELMFLIHHGIGHGFHRMKWLIDIVEFIKQGRVVWADVIEYTCKTKRINELFAGVILCYVMDAFDMPDIVSENFSIHKEEKNVIIELYQDNDKQFAKAIESAKRLVSAMKPVVCYEQGNRDFIVDSREYIKYYHTYIKEIDSFQGRKKIQRLWQRVQPGERDFNWIHLKDQCFVLYYILRPIYWVYLVIKR